MEYTELTGAHQEVLRRERVLALESDHYRILLRISEVGPEEPLQRQLAELEERLALYQEPPPELGEPEPGRTLDKAPD